MSGNCVMSVCQSRPSSKARLLGAILDLHQHHEQETASYHLSGLSTVVLVERPCPSQAGQWVQPPPVQLEVSNVM